MGVLCKRIAHRYHSVVNARGAKAKGRGWQNHIRDLLREKYEGKLEPDDITGTLMGEAGCDIKLSPAARKLFPWSVEAKRQEKISLHAWWNQAKANCKEGTKPVIITKQNNKEPLVIMSLEDFMNLL